MRSDANLHYLYEDPKKAGPDATKKYDGRVHFDVLSGFAEVGALEDKPHVRVLAAKVNSPHFGRDLKVVVLVNDRDGFHVVLCSTDLRQPAEEIVAFYRLRYQIEFVIPDAKGSSPARSCLLVQQAGLTHCQARSEPMRNGSVLHRLVHRRPVDALDLLRLGQKNVKERRRRIVYILDERISQLWC